MKKNILLILTVTLLLSISSYAQVRVADSNSIINAPSSSAFIDASSTTSYNVTDNIGKGFLFPRVNLTTFTFSPATGVGTADNYPNFFDGMLVYNTATTGVAQQGATEGGILKRGLWYYDNKSGTLTGGTWKPVCGRRCSN